MKIKNYFIAAAIITFASGITSCKKDNATKTSTDSATEAQTESADQTFYSNETDASTNDANASLEIYGGSNVQSPTGVKTPAFTVPCDATVTVDTSGDTRVITITYNGSSCDGKRIRTGTVTITYAKDVKWRDANAQVAVNFVNLKIKRNLDGKSVVINGTRTITNVTGGLLKDLATTDSIVHKIDDTNMSVTFDNGSQRTWETHFRRVFTYDNGVVISTTGSVSGVNRFGDNFSSETEAPLVVEQSCDFRLVSGEAKHTGAKGTTDITFGLDASGNPVTGCPLAFYMKVVWTGTNGKTATVILPY